MNKKQNKKAIQTVYDQVAESYDSLVLDMNYVAPDWLLKNFPEHLKTGSIEVLDLGCGSGNIGKILKAVNCSISLTGVDLSPNMIEQAKKKNIYNDLFVYDLDKPLSALNLKTFDAIVAFGVFEFLEDIPSKMNELSDLLCSEGLLLCSFQEAVDSDSTKPYQMTNHHSFMHYAYNQNEIVQISQRARIEPLKIDSLAGYTSPSIGFTAPFLLFSGKKLSSE